MTRSKRIEPLQEIASNAADQLSSGVADAQRRLAECERQLERLVSYRAEYAQSAHRQTAAIEAVRLQNVRLFLDRLSDAIRAQTQTVRSARLDYESKRSRWSEKRVEAHALGKAVERFKLEERRTEDRRDQDASDESAMRRWMLDR